MIHTRLLRKVIVAPPVILLVLFLSGCGGYASHTMSRPEMELNTDRPGSDIETIRLEKAKPQLCSNACNTGSSCVAWTYVKPGILGPDAHCRLKSQAPSPIRSSCCISGVK